MTRRAALVLLGWPVLARALPPKAGPRPEHPILREQTHLQTLMEATAWPPDAAGREAVDQALSLAFKEVERIAALIGAQETDSDIARINASAGGQAAQVSEETFRLIRRCAEWSEFSGGVFDVTYATMNHLWRFDGKNRVPDQKEVTRLRKLVDYRRLILDEARVSVMLPNPGMRLGLGGIARGYAMDRASQQVMGAGALAVKWKGAGGTLTQGRIPTGELKVGVPDPRAIKRAFMGVEVKDGALCTVGDYDRFFTVSGRRYHNIIDPRTGWPARACRQASVLAPSATDAEWLARSVFILGLKEAAPVLAKVNGAHAMVVTADNRVEMTDGFRKRSELLAPPTASEN